MLHEYKHSQQILHLLHLVASGFFLLIILCFCDNVYGQQNITSPSAIQGQDSINPLVPKSNGLEQSTISEKKPFVPSWWRPRLDSLGRRMILAGRVKPDSFNFRPHLIRTQHDYHTYHIWINEASILLRYKYIKGCKKNKKNEYDCFWQEVEIPYPFIDSIRSVEFAPGYIIHYTDLMLQPAKYKLYVSPVEIDMIARTIIARLKSQKIKVDSFFAAVYPNTWQIRVKQKLSELNRQGLVGKANKDKNKKSKSSPAKMKLGEDDILRRKGQRALLKKTKPTNQPLDSAPKTTKGTYPIDTSSKPKTVPSPKGLSPKKSTQEKQAVEKPKMDFNQKIQGYDGHVSTEEDTISRRRGTASPKD